jgi:acyl-homoserine lactone acylase PvdQ
VLLYYYIISFSIGSNHVFQILQEKNLPLSANFLLADSAGNIGYVQTGPLPVRRGSGLLPYDFALSGLVPLFAFLPFLW